MTRTSTGRPAEVVDPDTICEMYSVRVDEAWHQFILYTDEYMDLCRRFFGHNAPHSPSNAPQQPSAEQTLAWSVGFEQRPGPGELSGAGAWKNGRAPTGSAPDIATRVRHAVAVLGVRPPGARLGS
ncbi:glycine-rich domain-containing protein [Streptomyces niveus]|uniref:hypothetical protein n=1 Tax=Streptomyces niveus TaxID=193462 RepID=UPI003697375F